MSDWDDEEDQNSDLVKNLRKQLKDAKAAHATLETELSTLRPQVRKSSVSSILNGLGVNPKLAALVPESVEATDVALRAWLGDYEDLFTSPPKAEEQKQPVEPVVIPSAFGTPESPVDPAVQQSWTRLQSPESANGATAQDIESSQMAQLGAAATASGGDYEKFISLLRGETPLNVK